MELADKGEINRSPQDTSMWTRIGEFVVDLMGVPHRLFPHIPSAEQCEARRRENVRNVVSFVGGRESYSLAMGRYVTEEELEHRVGKFFDNLTYHLVHGYENAMKHSAAFSAHK